MSDRWIDNLETTFNRTIISYLDGKGYPLVFSIFVGPFAVLVVFMLCASLESCEKSLKMLQKDCIIENEGNVKCINNHLLMF